MFNNRVKGELSDSAIKTLTAFANDYSGTMKGYLLIGVTNSKQVIGLKGDLDQIQRDITDHCRTACDPPLAPNMIIQQYESKPLLLVEMSRSHSRPHRFGGVCYIRLGSATQKATAEEEFRIREDSMFRTFDCTPVP